MTGIRFEDIANDFEELYRIPYKRRDSGAIWYVLLFRMNFWVRQIYAGRAIKAFLGNDPASI